MVSDLEDYMINAHAIILMFFSHFIDM